LSQFWFCGKVIGELRTNVCFGFLGGDRLKFSDVILAMATMLVIMFFVYSVFAIVLVPSSMGSYLGQQVSAIISLIIAGLLVGFAFAGKIQEESRMRAVGKIAILLAAVEVFLVIISFSGNSYYWALVWDGLQSMYSTTNWTTTDWFVYEQMVLMMNVALNVALTLVLGFVTLYVGSMLRKPKKS
jgi:hypothetical protein